MRRFAVLLGATAPAVAAALAAVFFGLGLGSYLLGRYSSRLSRPVRVFAILEIATGLSALVVNPLIDALRPLYASLYDTSVDSAGLQLAMKMIVATIAVVVPAAATCAALGSTTMPMMSGTTKKSLRSMIPSSVRRRLAERV